MLRSRRLPVVWKNCAKTLQMPGFRDPAGTYMLADADLPANRRFCRNFQASSPSISAKSCSKRYQYRPVRSPRIPDEQGRLTSRSTWALIAALIALVGALALCVDRGYNGDFYMSLLGGRFISAHGFVTHDPFPTAAHGSTWLNQQWLSELAFFRVAGSFGQTGLTVIYAVLLAAPLALLLWLCRRKGAAMLVAITVIYFPGVLAVIHPRAAGFTVLAFSALVALIAIAWRSDPDERERPLVMAGSVAGILALFAIWANLHAGFIAGLLLIALVTIGLAIDHRRGIPGTASPRLVAALGLIGVLAAVTVSVATPLGGAIWSYILSFQNSAIDHASKEWRSALS